MRNKQFSLNFHPDLSQLEEGFNCALKDTDVKWFVAVAVVYTAVVRGLLLDNTSATLQPPIQEIIDVT